VEKFREKIGKEEREEQTWEDGKLTVRKEEKGKGWEVVLL